MSEDQALVRSQALFYGQPKRGRTYVVDPHNSKVYARWRVEIRDCLRHTHWWEFVKTPKYSQLTICFRGRQLRILRDRLTTATFYFDFEGVSKHDRT
jgi:hypothetical protein